MVHYLNIEKGLHDGHIKRFIGKLAVLRQVCI